MSLIVFQKIVAMSSTLENQILNMQERLKAESESRDRDKQDGEVGPGTSFQSSSSRSVLTPATRREFHLGIVRQLDPISSSPRSQTSPT